MPPKTMRLDPIVLAARDTAVTALASSPWSPLVAVGGQKQVLLYHSDTLELLGVLPFPEGAPNVLQIQPQRQSAARRRRARRQVGQRRRLERDEGRAAHRPWAKRPTAFWRPTSAPIRRGSPWADRARWCASTPPSDGKLQQEIRKHTDWVTALEFSPDGVLLATGDRNGGLFVWEAFTAREYFTLRGHTAAITEISWRTDSNVVASASEDTTIRLFEMENGNQIRGWGAHGGGVQSVRYSIDGKIVSAGRDRLVSVWDGNGTSQRLFEAFPDVALRSTFTHDSARVIAADWTGQIVVWNAADGKRIGTLTANPPTVAEQLALAQKALVEKQKSADALVAMAKASQATLAKVSADLAAAQKALGETPAAVKIAEQKLTQAKATVATAQAAVKTAQAEVKAKETLSQALAEAAAKVKAEADKAKDNLALDAASTRAQALAAQLSAELTLAQDLHGHGGRGESGSAWPGVRAASVHGGPVRVGDSSEDACRPASGDDGRTAQGHGGQGRRRHGRAGTGAGSGFGGEMAGGGFAGQEIDEVIPERPFPGARATATVITFRDTKSEESTHGSPANSTRAARHRSSVLAAYQRHAQDQRAHPPK